MEDIIGSETPQHRPIYINPEADVMYRGKIACREGNAFQARTKEWRTEKPDLETLAVTRTLAVDAMALDTRPQDKAREESIRKDFGYIMDYPEELRDAIELPEKYMKVLRGTPTNVQQLAECALRGLRTLLIVVNNDNNLSEILFTVYKITEIEHMSQREIIACNNTQTLREDLLKHWEIMARTDERFTTLPIPKVHIMTPLRKRLTKFTKFPQLPLEIQEMVWSAAFNSRRLHTAISHGLKNQVYVGRCQQPAVSQVCQASRKFYQNGSCFYDPDSNSLRYYNPGCGDIICLDLVAVMGHVKFYTGAVIPILGLSFPECAFYRISGTEIRKFMTTREIVILVGERRAFCESEIEYVEEEDIKSMGQLQIPYLSAQRYMVQLRVEMEKKSKQWKTYQKERLKAGKPASPDWVVPTVRLATIKNICESISPYSYPHAKKSIGYRHSSNRTQFDAWYARKTYG